MLATPMAVETLVNTVAFGRFLQPIMVLALILLMFLGFQGLVRALQTYVVEIIQRRLFARVAGDLAFRLPRVQRDAVNGHYLPELVNRFFDVVTVQKAAAQLLLDGLGLALNTVIGMAVLGFYHPWLLGFDLFLLAAIAVAIFGLGRGAVASAVKESKQKYFMAAWLEEIARCPTAFRSDGGAEFALERADRLIHEYLAARRQHFRIVMRQVLFALGLQALASTVLLGLGGWLVVSGELTLGQLVAAELIVTVIVGSFAKFGKHMESFYDLLASVDKLGKLFDLRMERPDGLLSAARNNPATVEMSGIEFFSPGSERAGPITCRIESGERVAVFGPAGSGKSTLLDMIYGARRCDSGHLTIDDIDPRDLRPDVLRGRVALARGEVFHATIEENVHMHREGVTASDVRSSLSAVGMLTPILRMPDACSTVLASHGVPLSETQQRLLGLARAMAGKPGVLLVDGLLDTLSGRQLDKVLDHLTSADRPWTLVVATSREDIARRFKKRIDLLDGLPTLLAQPAGV
jgi:ABC-type bacteriocin/lantibiotic exporter with double-glycine peptidase domain